MDVVEIRLVILFDYGLANFHGFEIRMCFILKNNVSVTDVVWFLAQGTMKRK